MLEKPFLLSFFQSNIIGTVNFLMYAIVLVMIFCNRNKQAVYFKSPWLIIICGISLFADSGINIMINTNYWEPTDQQYFNIKCKFICGLSILTTCTFHYISYFAIIFRAKRILRVIELEQKYLD